jgi:hypothetical protein
MKKITLMLLAISAGILSMTSCNNDDDDAACGDNVNFCVTIGSEEISGNASYIIITTGTPRHRVLWEEGSGATYKNIELDIYTSALTTGTYNFSATPTTGQAALQYFVNGQSFVGGTGSVTISSVSGSEVSGTFSGSVTFNSDTRTVSDGNFVNVPN